MRSRIILIHSLVWLVSACIHAQESPSLSGTLTEQGKPVSGALVILDHMKNAKCVRIFESKTNSYRDQRELESCEKELPRTRTDDKGNYSYPHLAPGWYNIRFWWLMAAPPPGNTFTMCSTTEWGVAFAPAKDSTGKYDGFAQIMPFELRKKESKQINFDYREQITGGANCTTMGGPVFDGPRARKPDEAQISIPDVKGMLKLAPGPTTWNWEFRPKEQQVRLQAMERADHLLVTAFLQKVPFEASAEKCRDARWPESEKRLRERQGKLDNVQQSSKDGIALVEFMLRAFQGKNLQVRDVHAFWGSGNLCAEVHLSKVQFEPKDQKLFDEVLATVRFLPDI